MATRRRAHRAVTRSRTDVLVAVLLAAAGATAVLLQLFLGGDVGLADNGDGFRLMCTSGLFKNVDVLFNPLVLHYVDQPYGCAAHLRYFSSEQFLLAPAVALYHLRYGPHSGFDLRALGVVHALMFGAGLGLAYLALPGSRLRRVVTVGVAGVLLVDVSFSSYFVSPFSEPAAFLGVLLVVAATAWYVRTERWMGLALVALCIAGLFLSLAKSQTAVFAAILVPVLLLRTVPVGRLAGRWGGHALPALAALVLLGGTGLNLAQQPVFFTQVNLHNLTFFTLLPDSADPAGTLRDLGAPAGLVRYSGTGFFTPKAAGKDRDPEYASFQQHVTRSDVVRYIATHPGEGNRLLRAGAQAADVVRVDYLSNYPDPRPADRILAPRPTPTRDLLRLVRPVAWPVLPLAWLAAAVAGAAVALRSRADAGRRATAAVCYLLGAGALSQVVVALLGDGYYELVKHTVLAGWSTALLVAVGAGALADAAARRARARRSDLPQPTAQTAAAGSTAG
jgi:hypothetical protein